MKLFIYQIITAGCNVARILIILSLGGTANLGLYSIIVSTITLTTILIQIYNNQGIQVKLIESDTSYRQRIINTLFIIGLFVSSICFLLVLILGKYFSLLNDVSKLSYWGTALTLAIPLAFISSNYDVKSISEAKIGMYYSSTTANAIVGGISSYLLLRFGFTNYIVFVPAISSLGGLVYYFVFYKFYFNQSLIDFSAGFDLKGVKKLIYDTWQINLIPLTTVTLDFIVRTILLDISGLVLLGYYQTVLSVESMTGNIFQAPYFSKILLSYTIDGGKNAYTLKKTIVGALIISTLPVFGLMVIKYLNDEIRLTNKLDFVFAPLIIIMTARIVWCVWGSLGQILISKKYFKFVSLVEVLNKTLVAGLLIVIMLIFNCGLWAYAYSVIAVAIMLLLLTIILLKKNSFLTFSK